MAFRIKNISLVQQIIIAALLNHPTPRQRSNVYPSLPERTLHLFSGVLLLGRSGMFHIFILSLFVI
jgi:hypothetical protein